MRSTLFARLQAMRSVTAAHIAAAKRPSISLHTALPSSMPWEQPILMELCHSRYRRQPVNFIPVGEMSGMLRSTETVSFGQFNGKFPVLVTHFEIHDNVSGRRLRSRLNHAKLISRGDTLVFPPGAIRVPVFEHWNEK